MTTENVDKLSTAIEGEEPGGPPKETVTPALVESNEEVPVSETTIANYPPCSAREDSCGGVSQDKETSVTEAEADKPVTDGKENSESDTMGQDQVEKEMLEGWLAPVAQPAVETETSASSKDDSPKLEVHVSAHSEDGDDQPPSKDIASSGVPSIEEAENGRANTPDSSTAEDDITSRAAIALAAVAVAANAKHSSPAAAAQAARALAPGIMPGAGMSPRRNQDMKVVSLDAVKQFMKAKAAGSIMVQKLAEGENDAFLQHLLLLEYFQIDNDSKSSVPDSPSANSKTKLEGKENHTTEAIGVFDQELTALAADRARAMLTIISGAYESMIGLLPSVLEPEMQDSDVECEFDGIETPPIVPDLLPPCTSTPGDATAEFFRECAGHCEIQERLDNDTEPEKEGGTRPDNAAEGVPLSETAHSSAASMFSSMFTNVKRSSITTPRRASITGVFRKRSRRHTTDTNDRESLKINGSRDHDLNDEEYSVLIEREMLGLTVENVLERTVVRTVLPGGAAKNAGAQVGSLIVKVGNITTKNLTHFETIDELRQSQRPLRLVMRQISGDALSLAREEMGRLIRGAGFGMFTDGRHGFDASPHQAQHSPINGDRTSTRLPQIEIYSRVLHERWTCDDNVKRNKSGTPIDGAGEKLVWILTLIVFGLEIEAQKMPSLTEKESCNESLQEKQRHHHHDAKDYSDAAKCISKVLMDFMRRKVCSERLGNDEPTPVPVPMKTSMNRRGRRGHPPPMPPAARAGIIHSLNSNNKPLLQIGDVLHRTYTFLADPTSRPAALLRGEVIAFLCDVLDIDSGMELSEEENASSTAGENTGPISDLGSAGSLLKLIILNCSMMRSPGCGTASSHSPDEGVLNEQRRRFGPQKQFYGVDAHRLHAGNRFLAVVHRLAASRSLSARVTACSLGPVLWGHLDFPHQLQLRGVITRALHDVDVIVRKSTATVLHEIAELVFDPRAVPWLVLMCERAMTDPEPQLRSAAMTLTWHLAEHLPNAFLGDASQGSRSVRRLPPRTDPTFAEVYLLQCKLLPVATRLAEDRAPSVRLAVAAQCDRLCNALGEHWSSVIIDVLQALLGDTDERVRSEAILCVPRLVETTLVSSSRHGPPDGGVGVLQALLPVSIKLQKDSCASVRIALATSAGELLTLLVGLDNLEEIPTTPSSCGESSLGLVEHGRARRYKTYVDETLIPLVQQLLNDTDPEVTSSALRAVTNASRGTVREMRNRLNSTETEDDTVSLSSFHSHASLEKKEPVFVPVLSESQVRRLLPTLTGLANSRQWRVRQGAVEIVPALLGCTNKLETRMEIARLCIHLMSDRVDAVRRTAAECLCLGGGALGSHGENSNGEWLSNIVLPHIRACGSSDQSKQRLLSLKMIEVMLLNGVYPPRSISPSAGGEADVGVTSPLHELLEVAVSLSTDRVANVRLNVGRVIGNVINVFEDTELSLVTKALKEQIEEEERQADGGDRDVLFFAKLAISRAQARLEEGSFNTPDTLDNSRD